MKRRTLLLTLVAILFAAAGAWFANKRLATTPAQDQAVASLFGQSLPDPGGKAQSLADLQGKPVLVNFWATWCAPCVKEMPELSDLQTELGPDKIRIIGIGIDTPANILEYSTKNTLSYPLYVAGTAGTSLAYQLGNESGGLPFSILVGADGHVRKSYLGRLKMPELRQDIAAIH